MLYAVAEFLIKNIIDHMLEDNYHLVI